MNFKFNSTRGKRSTSIYIWNESWSIKSKQIVYRTFFWELTTSLSFFYTFTNFYNNEKIIWSTLLTIIAYYNSKKYFTLSWKSTNCILIRNFNFGITFLLILPKETRYYFVFIMIAWSECSYTGPRGQLRQFKRLSLKPVSGKI